MNYLEITNEVLIRMREEEVTSVTDPENDPQQKLVCKFVNDAKALVERAHTWNALRSNVEQTSVYLVRYQSGQLLREVNGRQMEARVSTKGTPAYFAPKTVNGNNLELNVYPTPDESFGGSGGVFEYGNSDGSINPAPSPATGFFNEGSKFGSPDKDLIVFGYGQPPAMKNDDDLLLVPQEPVIHYTLAYAQRERGEAGGQASAEVFAMAKQYLSDAISRDVENSSGEYIWEAV
jgi:hypothetical protein